MKKISMSCLVFSITVFGGNELGRSQGFSPVSLSSSSSDDESPVAVDELQLSARNNFNDDAWTCNWPSSSNSSRIRQKKAALVTGNQEAKLSSIREKFNVQIAIPDSFDEPIRLPMAEEKIAKCHPAALARVVHRIDQCPADQLERFWAQLTAVQLLAPIGTDKKNIMALIQTYLDGQNSRAQARKLTVAKLANLNRVDAISKSIIDDEGYQPTDVVDLVTLKKLNKVQPVRLYTLSPFHP